MTEKTIEADAQERPYYCQYRAVLEATGCDFGENVEELKKIWCFWRWIFEVPRNIEDIMRAAFPEENRDNVEYGEVLVWLKEHYKLVHADYPDVDIRRPKKK